MRLYNDKVTDLFPSPAFRKALSTSHQPKGIFAEIAAVGFFAVDQEHRRRNLRGPGKQGLVQETLAADDVPTIGGIAEVQVPSGTLRLRVESISLD